MQMQKKKASVLVGAAAMVLSLLLGLWWSVRGSTVAPAAVGPDVVAAVGSSAMAYPSSEALGAASERVGGAAEAARAAGIEFHAAPPQLRLRGETQVYAEAPAHPTPPDQLPPPPIHVDPSVRGGNSAAWTGAPSP